MTRSITPELVLRFDQGRAGILGSPERRSGGAPSNLIEVLAEKIPNPRAPLCWSLLSESWECSAPTGACSKKMGPRVKHRRCFALSLQHSHVIAILGAKENCHHMLIPFEIGFLFIRPNCTKWHDGTQGWYMLDMSAKPEESVQVDHQAAWGTRNDCDVQPIVSSKVKHNLFKPY